MATKTKTGRKTRKYGRKKKKPAQMRYTLEKRWIKNKARRAAKRKRRLEKRALIAA